MTVQIDSREKARAIKKILTYFDEHEVGHYTSKLFVGDYMNLDNPRLVIDRKQNLNEVVSNVCQQHTRFKNEIERANENGIRIIFLIEHGGEIRRLEDVRKWKNPRLKDSPLAMSGERLYKVLATMKARYGIDFVFCSKENTGKKITELLETEK